MATKQEIESMIEEAKPMLREGYVFPEPDESDVLCGQYRLEDENLTTFITREAHEKAKNIGEHALQKYIDKGMTFYWK